MKQCDKNRSIHRDKYFIKDYREAEGGDDADGTDDSYRNVGESTHTRDVK